MTLIVHKAPFSIKLYKLETKMFYLMTIGIFISPFQLWRKLITDFYADYINRINFLNYL